MKGLLLAASLAAFACAVSAQSYKPYKYRPYKAPKPSSYAPPVRHNGYVKKDGTYVAPHYQTAPDSTKTNNWSSKPNVNPYTGEKGSKNPYAQSGGRS